jgi:hypothetical protein
LNHKQAPPDVSFCVKDDGTGKLRRRKGQRDKRYWRQVNKERGNGQQNMKSEMETEEMDEEMLDEEAKSEDNRESGVNFVFLKCFLF